MAITASWALPRIRPAVRRHDLPPLAPRLHAARSSLALVSVFSLCLVLELLLVSPLQQRAAQQRLFDDFRAELAAGTAPVSAGQLARRTGQPVAYLEVPAIGLRQVVVEGTSGGTLFDGPGHRRDTPLPGQAGTSVVLGRRAGFGGPFARIAELEVGSVIQVTTGAGAFEYQVRAVRVAGDRAPAAVRPGGGRLALATAAGRPFLPSGLALVDADLMVPAVGGSRPVVNALDLPAPEKAMAVDPTTIWRLVLWLQALLAVVLAAVWAWHRWDPAKAWVVCLPAFLLVGLSCAGEAARLLPNLL